MTHTQQEATRLSYREALAIGWRLFWQGAGGFLLALMAANLVVLGSLPELTRTGPSWWALMLPLLAATGLSVFVWMPLVARSLVAARFRTFRLDLVRGDHAAAAEVEKKGGAAMMRLMAIWIVVVAVAMGSFVLAWAGPESNEIRLHLVSGTLSKLDLTSGRGLLTTDLGRPIHFEVPKAYLFENVTVGARIALQLDDYGRAVKVMDTAIPDVIMPSEESLSATLGDEPPPDK